MDVKLEKWHKCQVDKEVLKELSKKSDLKGLQHVSVFFGLLLVTGILARIPVTNNSCLLYTSPSPRDGLLSRMPSSA